MSTDNTQSGLPIEFHVTPRGERVTPTDRLMAFLEKDRWDDWGKYCTQFYLTLVDPYGNIHRIGNVKIGAFGLKPHRAEGKLPSLHRDPRVPPDFRNLDDEFFSLGQEEEYYENLSKLGEEIREVVLRALRDVAFDVNIWELAKQEYVTTESLLRSVTSSMVVGQFRRMAHGGARSTPYSFSFALPKWASGGGDKLKLNFKVRPDSMPPTNVHVLIGRNGVGKSRLLALMTKSLVASRASARQSGNFIWDGYEHIDNAFANLVIVSFSAFDDSDLFPKNSNSEHGLKYSYIGLHRQSDKDSIARPKSPRSLAIEFFRSLKACQVEPYRRRWQNVLSILNYDPIFRSEELDQLIKYDLGDEKHKEKVLKTFQELSSGHKIVLLTLTKLVEKVEERTLVLMDEIEAHLHPPLLSAFIRSLSDLLVNRNGVSIIATHSPVVLQEVPQNCVWILNRSADETKAERPSIETFGENLGTLSREIFNLELSQSGFQKMIRDEVQRSDSYEEAVYSFNEQLGSEAKAILRAMLIEKMKTDN